MDVGSAQVVGRRRAVGLFSVAYTLDLARGRDVAGVVRLSSGVERRLEDRRGLGLASAGIAQDAAAGLIAVK